MTDREFNKRITELLAQHRRAVHRLLLAQRNEASVTRVEVSGHWVKRHWVKDHERISIRVPKKRR